MHTAVRLQPDDIIGICAPSGSFDDDLFSKGARVIQELGFRVRIPDGISARKRYLAGEDRHRADLLNRLFADTEVRGIVCARGGFGAMRILDYLDWQVIRDNPKPVVGFSDATALLMALLNRGGFPVVHGPSVVSLAGCDRKTVVSFQTVLVEGVRRIRAGQGITLAPGQARGVLMGGNLATLNHLTGTPYQPDFRDAVLFLEDISEPAYKIDRMLVQMKSAGLFAPVKGVVLGSFTGCDPLEMIYEIVTEIFEVYRIPVFAGIEAGHGNINLSLPMGGPVGMDASEHTLVWHDVI